METAQWVKDNGVSDRSFIEQFDERSPGLRDQKLIQFHLSGFLEEYHGDRDVQSGCLTDEFLSNEDEEEREDQALMGPFSKICDYMAKGLDLRFNHRVKEIDYTGSKVKVICESEIFEAERVVLTVPLSILKSGKLKFVPELPACKQEAYDRTQILQLECFYLNFEEVFWINKIIFGYLGEDTRRFCFFENPHFLDPNNKVLKTKINGRLGSEIDSMSDEAVIEEIMNNLRDIYGPDIPYPINFHRSNWCSNPNSLGAGIYFGLKSKANEVEYFVQSLENKVFFAGDYTCSKGKGDMDGNVHGAYTSGVREARKIIELIAGSE